MLVRGLEANDKPGRTVVDDYWGEVTVQTRTFPSAADSLAFLALRMAAYPLFAEYMEAYGDHAGETVLDFGCGPGHDLIGFLVSSKAARVIGIDVSPKALDLARGRVQLHAVDPERVQLIRSSDGESRVPLDDSAVDYIHCLGVIHHTSHPGVMLRELARVLKPGGRGSIMVYNRDSIFFHLWIAYQQQLISGYFPGLAADDAFSRATDGEDCPFSRAYRPDDFLELCRAAGFEAEFVGGYFAALELELMHSAGPAAIDDQRLHVEHRNFLRSLTVDARGHFLHRGRTAGHGGVYAIRKQR